MGDVAFMTSGSSGAAKPVVRTEESLSADAAALVAAFPEVWGGGPPVVASVPKDHMYGALWRVRAPSMAGCAVEPDTVLSVENLLAARERLGRFLFVTTPSFLEKLVAHPDAPSLRGAFSAIVTSGSLLRAETSLAAESAFGTSPLEIFGSTEAGSVAFRRRAADGDLWTLVPGVSASTDSEGRITVVSPFAMSPSLTLSDAASFVDSRRFRLLGRTDRRVKILEEFVSLPAVESAMESHPLVARCRAEAFGDGVTRIGALVVPTAGGLAALASGTHGALAARLRRDLAGAIVRTAFPRRIRFVRALPVDARGKTTASDVRAALGAWCREPAVLEWSPAADALSATLAFPPDCECFDGHFPGIPILPGVAQLFFVHHFASQAFPDFPCAPTYRRLKFQKIVIPGERVALRVARTASGAFSFSLEGPNGPCTRGEVSETGKGAKA